MLKSAIVLLMALFLFAGCTPRKVPEARFSLQKEEVSPKGDFVVRRYVDGREPQTGERQLWIVGPEGASYLLFKYFRIAFAVVSPGESHLIINDRRDSHEAGVLLYERNRAGRFVPTRVNLEKMVWRRFYDDFDLDRKKFSGFDHHYVWCPRWIDDASLQLCLEGYGDQGLIEKWAYAYHLDTQALVPDPRNDVKWLELPGLPQAR